MDATVSKYIWEAKKKKKNSIIKESNKFTNQLNLILKKT